MTFIYGFKAGYSDLPRIFHRRVAPWSGTRRRRNLPPPQARAQQDNGVRPLLRGIGGWAPRLRARVCASGRA